MTVILGKYIGSSQAASFADEIAGCLERIEREDIGVNTSTDA